MLPVNKEYYKRNPFTVLVSLVSGTKYVDWHSVRCDTLNTSFGNSKVGKVGCFNFPIEYTCVNCECKQKRKCYALNGCYMFHSNQATYSENYAFWKAVGKEAFADAMVKRITENKWKLFRYFTCGDIPEISFFDAMVEIAKRCPNAKFWLYTKKYGIVNIWCNKNGVDAIPENLTVIFSHWLNDDGSYFPMSNPYNFPTSEFIPLGKEELKEQVTFICPCSDPNVYSTCETCEHPCFDLKHGQSMALLEHSTPKTRKRDKAIRKAKEAIRKALKGKK